MARVELLTEINAPRDRVFDLARSIDLHTESMNRSKEYAAARLMMRSVLLAAIAIFVGCASSRPEFENEPVTTPFCHLIAVPDDQLTRVEAVYRSGFETSELVDSDECLPGISFWVAFTDGYQYNSTRSALRQFREASGNRDLAVVFVGTVECRDEGPGGYGHLDWHLCQFEVLAVERVLGRVANSSD